MKKLLFVLSLLMILGGCSLKGVSNIVDDNIAQSAEESVAEGLDADTQAVVDAAKKAAATTPSSKNTYNAHTLAEDTKLSGNTCSHFLGNHLVTLCNDQIWVSDLNGTPVREISPPHTENEFYGCIGVWDANILVTIWGYDPESQDDIYDCISERLVVVDIEGNCINEIHLDTPYGKSGNIAMTAEQEYVITYWDRTRFYDANGTLQGEIDGITGVDLISCPGESVLLFYEVNDEHGDCKQFLAEVDGTNHSIGAKYELPVGMDIMNVRCDKEGTLYLFNRPDEYDIWPHGAYIMDDKSLTLLFTWEKLGREDGESQYIVAPYNSEHFFFTVLNISTYEMSAILVDTEAPEETKEVAPVETITLACWQSDALLETLVREFNKKSEQYSVEIMPFYNEYDVDGSYNKMLTELATGGNADVYYLAGLNVEDLWDKGLLVNLYELMNADSSFQISDYYENIWENWTQDGRLYALAPYFTINTLVGANNTLAGIDTWGWPEFQKFCDNLGKDIIPVQGLDRDDLIQWIVLYSLSDFVDLDNGICSFDSKEFVSLLEFANTFPADAEIVEDFDVFQGRCALVSRGLNSVADYAMYKRLFPGGFSLINFPSEEKKLTASCMETFGLSSTATVNGGGWTFLKFLLSEEIQVDIFAEMGWPVSQNAMDTILSRAQLDVDNTDSPFYNVSGAQALSPTDANRLIETMDAISGCDTMNRTIQEILLEEVQAYFHGNKSSEAVSEIIQNRVRIYLSERN